MTHLAEYTNQWWFQQTLSDLIRHEGMREYAYPDPLSKLGKADPLSRKYGWGSKPATEILAKHGFSERDGRPWTVGVGYTRGVTPSSRMNVKEAISKLSGELYVHLPVLNGLIPDWETFPDVIKAVLANMAFNMGNRLTQFTTSLELLRHRRFPQAGSNLRGTLWYKQVGARAEELCKRLETGQVEKKNLVKWIEAPADFSDVVSKVTSTEEFTKKD